MIIQDTDGNVYLAPEYQENTDAAAMTAKPILSLSLDSVLMDEARLVADRVDTNFASPAPVCFLEGTLIATPTGPRAVETLQQGDLVVTADGQMLPVLWRGSSTSVPNGQSCARCSNRSEYPLDSPCSKPAWLSPGNTICCCATQNCSF